jgi:hypothetical protein
MRMYGGILAPLGADTKTIEKQEIYHIMKGIVLLSIILKK